MKCGSANWVFKILSPSLLEGNVDTMLVNIGYKAVYSVRNLLNKMASRTKNVFSFQKPILRFSGSFIYKHWYAPLRPLGRPRHRWEDNIKMDFQEVGGGCGDCMELAQDRDSWRALVSTVMNLRVPKMRGISWLAAEPVSFSWRTLLLGVSK